MRRNLRILLIVLAFVPVVALLAVVGINLRDEPLDAGLVRVLETPTPEPSENARRAHLYLLGLAAGERTDPERRGRELLPQTADPAVFGALDAHGWTRTRFEGCPDSGCGKADLDRENVEHLDRAAAMLGLYLGLLEFEDLAFDEPALALPGPRVHQLFTLQLARWLDQGGEVRAWHALEVAHRFYSRVLTRGPLLARVIALQNLDESTRFLDKARADHPRLRVPGAVLDAITLADADGLLGGAIPIEMKRLARSVEDLGHGPGRLGLRPHETLDRIFDVYNQVLFTDCASPEPACVPALDYLGFGRSSHWVVNPVGRYFATEVGRSLNTRRAVEGKLAAVARAKHAHAAESR